MNKIIARNLEDLVNWYLNVSTGEEIVIFVDWGRVIEAPEGRAHWRAQHTTVSIHKADQWSQCHESQQQSNRLGHFIADAAVNRMRTESIRRASFIQHP